MTLPERFPAQPQDLLNFLGRRVANQQLNAVLRLAGRSTRTGCGAHCGSRSTGSPCSGAVSSRTRTSPTGSGATTSSSTASCPVISCEDVDAEVWRFVVTPTDPTRDPLVRVAVFRGAADTLCVKVDHAASDAAGAQQFVALLAEAYAGLAPGAEPIGAPKPQRERGQGQVFRGIDPATLGRIGGEFRGGGRPAFGWPPPSLQSDGIAFSVRASRPNAFAA